MIDLTLTYLMFCFRTGLGIGNDRSKTTIAGTSGSSNGRMRNIFIVQIPNEYLIAKINVLALNHAFVI